MLEFTKKLVDWLPIGPDNMLLGLHSFSSEPKVRISLGNMTTKDELIDAVDHKYDGGSTDTAAVLR